jgi:hypothetical protein
MIDSNQRITELAEILALVLQRFWAQQSSQNLSLTGESSLHISADQSGDAPTSSAEVSNG